MIAKKIVGCLIVGYYCYGCKGRQEVRHTHSSKSFIATEFADMASRKEVGDHELLSTKSRGIASHPSIQMIRPEYDLIGLVRNNREAYVLMWKSPKKFLFMFKTTIGKEKSSPRRKVINQKRYERVCSLLSLTKEDLRSGEKAVSLDGLKPEVLAELGCSRSHYAIVSNQPLARVFFHWGNDKLIYSEIVLLDL
jgi:hypothetical protein